MRAAAKARRAKQRTLPESAYKKAFEKSAGKEGRLEKKVRRKKTA